ncbi:alpha 1,2 mannosyltransferase [Zalaria obscura]|uniref:Alpha 1,2 mannosyltransferase n=1 Tax=Zalaria obscura TaxID=2024903 RepID=A0ACC3SHD0_9PEZI
MWRRIYLLLVLLRLYYALSPSYLHPDEHFQGPEVIAGRIFGYPSNLTWEFTSATPIRSVFPLWLIYGWPLTILKWIWEGFGWDAVPATVTFYTLRVLMFTLSFVLEDWALQELVTVPKHRRVATLLVASSYVTWTFQTHTFSNSLETILVLWCLVLIARIKENAASQKTKSAILAFLIVLGIFNRITFPAFLLIPGISLLLHLRKRLTTLLTMILSATLTVLLAIMTDTDFYTPSTVHLRTLPHQAILTPLNNFLYNFDPSNLAAHGLHPYYQHLVVNLPQLLGPAFPLLFLSSRKDLNFYAALSGALALSLFQHQEARFLLPAVPLLLSSIQLPRRLPRLCIGVWVAFNAVLGVLMGVYHQGGVVPTQLWIGSQSASTSAQITHAFWWKTYSPPRWLLGSNHNVTTIDFMGIPGPEMLTQVAAATLCGLQSTTVLVAPLSAEFLDAYVDRPLRHQPPLDVSLSLEWQYGRHLNLDDMDFGDDGVGPTLSRVVGRRGLGVWRVVKPC